MGTRLAAPAIRICDTPAMSRPLRVFISDLHLTDELDNPRVAWEEQFARFWARIDAARGEGPAELVLVGDFVDLIRSPRWLMTEHRPYHSPSPEMLAVVDAIVDGTIIRNKAFFAMIRGHVQAERLKIHHILGNHDRLLAHAPAARQRLWLALTGETSPPDAQTEKVFADHNVLAYHGHAADLFSHTEGGGPALCDAIALELVVRFPMLLRDRIEIEDPHLYDIDDVRPIYAVPSWIRHLGSYRKGLVKPLTETWKQLVEEFLAIDFVKDWIKDQRKVGGMDPGRQLKLMLQLSTGRIMATTQDKRLTKLYTYFQHALDGQFSRAAAARLQSDEYKGLRYVVNGHSHFASMVPLGRLDAGPACYFNTGTWRTVHQMGHTLRGRPAFIPVEAMSYVAFFGENDDLGRDFEWWTGAMVARDSHMHG
jgi:UDP-2,3-diacylglucosamine pyrophosphatase LpxH